MSADKYPSIFSRQMETIVYIFSRRGRRPSRLKSDDIQRVALITKKRGNILNE